MALQFSFWNESDKRNYISLLEDVRKKENLQIEYFYNKYLMEEKNIDKRSIVTSYILENDFFSKILLLNLIINSHDVYPAVFFDIVMKIVHSDNIDHIEVTLKSFNKSMFNVNSDHRTNIITYLSIYDVLSFNKINFNKIDYINQLSYYLDKIILPCSDKEFLISLKNYKSTLNRINSANPDVIDKLFAAFS